MALLTGSLVAAAGKIAETAVAKGTLEKLGRLALGRLSAELLSEADSETTQPLMLSLAAMKETASLAAKVGGVSFRGIGQAERLSDLQKGPTCWCEALENIVQIMLGDSQGVMNDLSDTIYSTVAKHVARYDAGFVDFPGSDKPVLGVPSTSFPLILQDMGLGLEAKSIPFSHKALQRALAEHRPAILSGSVRFLPEKYPEAANAKSAEFTGHAVVAIDYHPGTHEYTILDSNSPEPYKLSADAIGRFMTDDSSRLCITKQPADNWEHKTAHIGRSTITFSLGEEAMSLNSPATTAGKTFRQSNPVSFGTSCPVLQLSAELAQKAEHLGTETIPGALLDKFANVLSGAGKPGMEIIKEAVRDAASFYGIKAPKAFFEKGELGAMWKGFSDASYDDWVGGDPKQLAAFSATYGGDFAKATMGHEIGHHVFERLGLRKAFEEAFGEKYGRLCNEAAADFLSGLYCGSMGLDGSGFAEFLANDSSYLSGLYPKGSVRSALFKEGYATATSHTWKKFQAVSYEWQDFKSVLHDPAFNLRDKLVEVANRAYLSATGEGGGDIPAAETPVKTGIARSGKQGRKLDKLADKASVSSDVPEAGEPLPSGLPRNAPFAFRASQTGDASFDRLMDDVQQFCSDCRAETRKIDKLTGGVEGRIKRGIAKLESERAKLQNYIQRTLAWLDQASPEERRRFAGEIEMEKWKNERDAKRIEDLYKEREWSEQRVKHQNKEQYEAEKQGYRQVNPWGPYYGQQGDPNIFEKNGEYYRLIPGTGGKMEHLLL